jgi:hypothetical protein
MPNFSTYPAIQLNQNQEGPLDAYAKLVALRNAVEQMKYQRQARPLELERQQQENQQRGLTIQQQQQALKDQQAMTQAMQDWDGQDFNQLPVLIKQKGGSYQAVMSTKSGIVAYQKELAAKSKDELANEKIKNDYFAQAIDNVKNLPPEQQPQAFEAAKQDAVKQGHLDPQQAQGLQYQGPQQLDMLEKSFIGHSAAVETALKQQQAASSATDQQFKQMEIAQGGAPTDTTRFISNWIKTNNLPDTPANRLKGQQEYNRETRIVPAQIRVDAYQKSRMLPGIDTKNNNALVFVTPDMQNAEPGRYVPAGEGAKALNKTALIEDIRGNIQQTRDSLNNAKMPEFTASQRAQIAIALGGKEPASALSAAIRGGVLGNLTPEQQDYLINHAQLVENAMAMRSVLGAGQGSEDMRSAIKATIPGPNTPSKAYAQKQLDKFETVLNRLEQGVPNVPLRQVGGKGSGASLPHGNGRVIDKATAQQFYDAAGGDPNRARTLATQNGWKVQ